MRLLLYRNKVQTQCVYCIVKFKRRASIRGRRHRIHQVVANDEAEGEAWCPKSNYCGFARGECEESQHKRRERRRQ